MGWGLAFLSNDVDDIARIDQIRIPDLAEAGQFGVLERVTKVVRGNIP